MNTTLNPTLELVAIGTATGVILPPELLEQLRVRQGDVLYVSESSDGVTLSAVDPALTAQLDVAEAVMQKRRTLLRKLAE